MSYCTTVREFAKACHKNLPETPQKMSQEDIDFAIKMVRDEMFELKEAKTITDQADAIVDAMYYLCDVAVRAGINTDPIFRIVHNANMTKVVKGKAKKREDGKVIKPPGFVSPEPLIENELKRQKYCGSF